ncbi:MAG TPA: hypothetical protein EYP10_08380, partial [Armatimonadetes bacterium]|nr:hypothetical protein [Armatimonadota bacterium]
PCNPATGVKVQHEVDVSLESGLIFQRHYVSSSQGSAQSRWLFGPSVQMDKPVRPSVAIIRSRDYDTPQKACSSGWANIREQAFNGAAYPGATVTYWDGKCSIKMNNGRILRLPVKASNGSLPVGISAVSTNTVTHTLYHPNGQQHSFYKPGNIWLSFYDNRLKLEQQGDHWSFTTAEGARELYDPSGRLVSHTPLGGLPTTYAYNVEGRLTTIAGPHDRTLTLGYDAEGRMTTLGGPDGRIHYHYEDPDQPQNLTRVVYPDGTSKIYHYEEPNWPGNLTGITDENGNRYATWDYDDASGKVILSEHAGGAKRVEFTYNADGTTTVAETISTDPANPIRAVRTYHFEVVASQLRASLIEGDRCNDCANSDMKQREYHDTGQLKRVTDWNGNITDYTYNSRHLRESITEGVGQPVMRRTRYEYHPDFPKPTRITRYRVSGSPEAEEPLQVTLLTYTPDGHLASRTLCDPGGDGVCDSSDPQRTTTWTYTAQGLIATEDGPRTDITDITTYDYDTQGNRTKITNALNQTTQITQHDAAGRPLAITDPNGVVTRLTYDARGRLIQTGTAGAVTRMTYDAAGNLIRLTQPDGATLTYSYDAAHHLIAVKDALGNRIDYTLDASGNRIREEVFDGNGQLRRMQQQAFDRFNRLREVIGAADQRTRYDYDPNGNRIASVDANGHATGRAFDPFDVLIETWDALDGVTSYQYDALGNLIQVTAPNGAVTTYRHDALGNLLSEQSPDRGLRSYIYD